MGYNLLINGVYGGYNPLILTIDPNFRRDIQVIPSIFRSATAMACAMGENVSVLLALEVKLLEANMGGRNNGCYRFLLGVIVLSI